MAVAAVLAVPILLAAGYWLLVVNGPTPVVKARIDDPGNNSIKFVYLVIVNGKYQLFLFARALKVFFLVF